MTIVDAGLKLLQPWNLFVGYSLLINPFAEEWFWRGFVCLRYGVFYSAAGFAIMHVIDLTSQLSFFTAAVLSAPIFCAGFFWSLWRSRSGNLWPCVITHIGIDLAILLALQRT
jgi:membrane protease YdiL (CAAX protease family)